MPTGSHGMLSTRKLIYMNKKLEKTLETTKLLLKSKKYSAIFLTVTIGFLALFLAALQNLTFTSSLSFGIDFAHDLSIMFNQQAPFQFEPIAFIELGIIQLLFSPINFTIGLVLAVLTGLNIAFSYISWKQPHICSVNKSTGLLSSAPALLAGSACCAPFILIILGLQVTAALLVFISILIPLALALLVINLVVSANKVRVEKLREEIKK